MPADLYAADVIVTSQAAGITGIFIPVLSISPGPAFRIIPPTG